MKVKRDISRRHDELGTPPPQLVKCGILTLDEAPCVKPLKLNSMKYVSPLGNVAQPKKKRKPLLPEVTKIDNVSPLGNVAQPKKKRKPLLPKVTEIDGSPAHVRKKKSKSKLVHEHETTNMADVILIPDTPHRPTMKNPSCMSPKSVTEIESHFTMETDDSRTNGSEPLVTETSQKRKKHKLKKKRKRHDSSCDLSVTETGNSQLTYDTTPTQPDLSSDKHLVSESLVVTRGNGVKKNRKESKKERKKRIRDEQESSGITHDFNATDPSPPKKVREVSLSDDIISDGKLSVTINNRNEVTLDASPDSDVEAIPNNVTIDLEPDLVDVVGCSTPDVSIIQEGKGTSSSRKKKSRRSALNNTIVLSDEDNPDDADDIIVLGSPIVPSVRGYKEIISRKVPFVNSSLQPQPTSVRSSSENVIAKAVSQLQASLSSAKTFPADRGFPKRRDHYLPPSMSGVPPFPADINGGNSYNPHSNTRKEACNPTPSTSGVPPSPANVYGDNLYNPSGCPTEKKGLRPIIIDGSNIAMGHGNGRVFSCKGIQICVNYFLKKGHKVFAFVPQFRRNNTYTKDAYILENLHKTNTVIFTPSRYVNGKHDVPYDDRYIVQTAAELGGVIVSTDNYRDLLTENNTWHDVIKNRLLMFTWVEDLLIFPQDPLGKRGGSLDAFLRFPR